MSPRPHEPQFNATAEQALAQMQVLLDVMRGQPRGQLGDMSPDDAFEEGYNVAIHDLAVLTGPDPRVPHSVSSNVTTKGTLS